MTSKEAAPAWTPGPWEVYREDGLPVSVRTLAPDCYGSRVLKYFAFLQKNAEANARLIAASPALYEALSELYAACEQRASRLTKWSGCAIWTAPARCTHAPRTTPAQSAMFGRTEMRLNTETIEREGDLFTVPMTQYLMPNGRTTTVQSCDLRGADLADKAQAILDAGHRFECEMLSDYCTISFTVFDPEEEDDIAGPFLVANGPGVPETIESMIRSFAASDTDGSPEGRDRNGLDGAAATAGASERGIADPTAKPPTP